MRTEVSATATTKLISEVMVPFFKHPVLTGVAGVSVGLALTSLHGHHLAVARDVLGEVPSAVEEVLLVRLGLQFGDDDVAGRFGVEVLAGEDAGGGREPELRGGGADARPPPGG